MYFLLFTKVLLYLPHSSPSFCILFFLLILYTDNFNVAIFYSEIGVQ